ncbi:MAG: hypothetical protein IKJ69_01630 [Clostridia bacterium]|nr:hypothetical protein [Clostridia bacterium]
MSNAKRFLSVILAIVMLCSTLVIGANAAYTAYKDSAIIGQYNKLDKAVLTTEQYASAAIDEIDRMLTKEQLKFTREDIIVGDIDLTSVDAAMDSVYTIVNGALFSSLKGMLGDLQYLNADAFAPEAKGGVRRATAGKTDADILYAVFQFLHDNTDLLVSFVEGTLDTGSILSSLIDLSEFMDVNKLLKGLLYEFTYGVEGTDAQVAASSVDTMAQDLIDKYVVEGYDEENDEGVIEHVDGLVPALAGKTNISTGTMYTLLDNVLKVLYNELLVPLLNSELKRTIQELCGVVYTTNEETGEETSDASNLNKYADIFDINYVVPTYEFTSDTLVSQINNVVKSVFDVVINPEILVWQAGDKTQFKPNLVNVAKQLFINAGDELFADYVELATPEEIEAMDANELVIYAARAIVNSSAYGMYVPEADTLPEFAFYALKQVLATDVPELDFSALDPNNTDSLVIMGIDYAIHALSSEIDMGLEFVYDMDGVDAQLKKAADYAVDNYSGVLNGITFNDGASGWETIDTVIFSIIPENWLPASANGSLQNFLFTLIDTIAALDFDALFALFEYRADSELQSTPKQVIINLVSRVINIIFPGAFRSATTIDALVTNQALAGTVRAIFDALWNYKENLAQAILPIVCNILNLTNDQEFEFPELTWDPTNEAVDGNKISTPGSVLVKLMIRNGSTGINTGYTDANGVFHQDQLYTYDVKSITSNISTLSISAVDQIAGGQTVEVTFNGSVKESTPLVVTMTYDVLTEDGSPLTDEPITETMYSYIAYNESDDSDTPLTSNTVGGFSIVDGPRYLYASGMGDLTDITVTVQNTNASQATAVPYAVKNISTNNMLPGATKTAEYLQVLTDETTIMQQVEDTAGIANIKLYETTAEYDALSGEEKEAVWDEIIEAGMVYNPRNGAVVRTPKIQMEFGAMVNGSSKVSNAGALIFCYKDYGLPGMLDSEMGKHRQPSAYGTAASTVYAGKTVWEAYNQAMEEAAKAVYSSFLQSSFSTPTGKFTYYEPAYNNLSAAIEELEAQVLSAGVDSSIALIEACYPSNPEDLPYYDPAYIHMGVSDYVAYTYYNFRDELRTLEGMIDAATIPDEEGNVAVINELDKAYNEHRFSLYFGRLLKAPSYKAHLEAELANPTRAIGAASEYSDESWTNYQNALTFATATANEAAPNQTKIKTAYRELLEAEKRLVPPTEGGEEPGDEPTFEFVNPAGTDAELVVIEAEDGTKILTGIGNANDGGFAAEEYFACEGCYVEVETNDMGEFSTRAVVTVKNSATDAVIDTYVIATYGDVNGDTFVDSSDMAVVQLVNAAALVPDDVQSIAVDVNLDNMADSSDYPFFVSITAASAVADSIAREIVVG